MPSAAFSASVPWATSVPSCAVSGVLSSLGAPPCESESLPRTEVPFSVPSSATVPESPVATGASLTDVTVIVTVASADRPFRESFAR